MAAKFNPNELILERIKSIIFNSLQDGRVIGRLTQIEDPSLTTSAEGEDVVDAIGSVITTIYKAKTGEFSASNSLFSLDLAAMQFGAEKVVADETNKIVQYCEEMLTISDKKATLSHTPVEGSIKYVYTFNNGDLGDVLTLDATAASGKFSISDKEITFDEGVTGRAYVEYSYETSKAVSITNNTEKFPESVGCKMFTKFRDKCNDNLIYYGTIIAQKAKIDPSSVELALNSTGKHAFTMKLMKDYCSEDADLFSIIVSED